VHQTRIVATVGPACATVSELGRMIQAGVDVFRFNLSHGNHESHAQAIARARAAAERHGRPIGILLDLQGPKVRTAKNEGGTLIPLHRGEEIRIANGRGFSTPRAIVVDYPGLVRDVKLGDRLLIDDGKLALQIVDRGKGGLMARVLRGGPLKSRAGVNVPARALRLRVPTEKDRRDAAFACEERADFLALSFVRDASDILRLRSLLARRATPRRGQHQPLVVAKIEKPSALDHLDEILEASDGVMVARGDLGVELSLERVPVWQKEILYRARRRGVFTITATQMLESMVRSATPTRAEVSDVANAIFDGSDAVMLSGETASGDFPLESVRMLVKVAREAERHLAPHAFELQGEESGRSAPRGGAKRLHANAVPADDSVFAMVEAARALAERADAKKIVVFTLRGVTARLLASRRPTVEVIALTPREETRRGLTLAFGTRSFLLPRVSSTDQMMRNGVHLLRRERVVRRGDRVVLLAGAANLPEATNLLRLVTI